MCPYHNVLKHGVTDYVIVISKVDTAQEGLQRVGTGWNNHVTDWLLMMSCAIYRWTRMRRFLIRWSKWAVSCH